MSDYQLVNTSFSIETNRLLAEVLESIVYTEAKYLELRGYIQSDSETIYNGVLEGPKDLLTQLFDMLSNLTKFTTFIKKLHYANFKFINEYTQEPFAIITKCDGKLWRSEFKITGVALSTEFFDVYACKRAQDLKLRGHLESIRGQRFSGVIEGRRDALEKLRHSLVEHEKYKNKIQHCSFSKPQEITHYTEDPFGANSTERQLFYCEFEIYGKEIPDELYEIYIEKRAQIAGARGSIEAIEGGAFFGRLEGERYALECIQEDLSNADQFSQYIEKCIFTDLKPLDKFTTKKFVRISAEKLKKLYRCDFEIRTPSVLDEFFNHLINVHAELWKIHGNITSIDTTSCKGFIEGDIHQIECLKNLTYLMSKTSPKLQIVYDTCKVIDEYTCSVIKI